MVHKIAAVTISISCSVISVSSLAIELSALNRKEFPAETLGSIVLDRQKSIADHEIMINELETMIKTIPNCVWPAKKALTWKCSGTISSAASPKESAVIRSPLIRSECLSGHTENDHRVSEPSGSIAGSQIKVGFQVTFVAPSAIATKSKTSGFSKSLLKKLFGEN